MGTAGPMIPAACAVTTKIPAPIIVPTMTEALWTQLSSLTSPSVSVPTMVASHSQRGRLYLVVGRPGHDRGDNILL
jgi:hypothetical protein